MNEQEIDNQYTYIRTLIKQKRLKEAITQLNSIAWQSLDYNQRTQLEQIEMAYKYMLQYMEQDIADSEREKLYMELLAKTLEISDQGQLSQLDNVSNRYYHECRRKRFKETDDYTTATLMHILESFQDDLAVSGLIADNQLDNVLQRHESALKSLFFQTWSNSYWNTQEEEEANGMLTSDLLPVNDLCLFTSAVTFSLLECLDIPKLRWLVTAAAHPIAYISQRAMVGITLTLHRYNDRWELYPEIGDILSILNEKHSFDEIFLQVYKQLLLCQETEKIDKKMREEIIPEMLKGVSSMHDMKLDFGESDEEKDDQNPDWENIFEQSKLGEKLREMNELQLEGADVYMSTFSALKGFPFFKEIHNWFYPFDKQQSSIMKTVINEDKDTLLDLILSSGFFCNSDKYSLFFMMQQFPKSQRDRVFSQLTEQQIQEFTEQSNIDSRKKIAEYPTIISNQYLHDLYRFFKLNPRKHEFRNIFKEKIELHKVQPLMALLNNEYTLATLVEFHLKKEHWTETVEYCKDIIGMNGQLSMQSDLYEKLGYALQKLKRIDEAIVAYLSADMIKPDNVWVNRHLAVCYRLLREFDKALEYYRKVAETNSENRNTVFQIGNCLTELGQYEEALNHFFKLDFMENNSLKAWRGIGWCSFLAGKYEQAAKYYVKVIEQKPLAVDYLNAGHTAWVSREMKSAIAFYRQAFRLSQSKDGFMDDFYKDMGFLIERGIAENDLPLMLDLISTEAGE